MNGNMNLGKRVTVLEKEGGEEIKKEISDLQVAVATAQNDIDAMEQKVNIGHEYSTEEKAVGTWNGKTLYEKTITGTFVDSKSTLYIGDVEVFSIIGVVNLSDGSSPAIGINLDNAYYATASYTKSISSIEVTIKGWTELVDCVVTVQYTKNHRQPTN